MFNHLAGGGGSALCGALAAIVTITSSSPASAQSSSMLPPVTVTAPKSKPSQPRRATHSAARSNQVSRRVAARHESAPSRVAVPATVPASLTVATAQQALREIQQTPGGVEVVPDTAFKNGPANTVQDILGWVPGVITQMRYGPDARLSIRGSGLSRSYGNRGINPLMDGIPISTSDGLFDLFEVDPTAYRYVEVYKGANALRYGANSLGGAINFVMPTGHDASPFEARFDAGSFGYVKSQFSTGGVALISARVVAAFEAGASDRANRNRAVAEPRP